MEPLSLPLHLRLRARPREFEIRLALRAALTAAHLLGVAAGTHLRRLRGHADPLIDFQGQAAASETRARLALETADLLRRRFARIPERRRPHYTPAQRFRILEIKSFLGWSAQQTAATFLLSVNTILNWEKVADPDSATAGSLVRPTPPVRRAADVVRATVRAMARFGFGGDAQIAQVLARAGWRVSARSVGRYRKPRRSLPDPTPPGAQKKSLRPLVTRFVHHTWMLDVSVFRQFLGPDLFMAAIFDAHSRAPLAVALAPHKPRAKTMALLLRRAVRVFGSPRYVATDLGGEFTGRAFQRAVSRAGATQRFASADSILATARLERFWRTLKDLAGFRQLRLPLDIDEAEDRLQLALSYYLAVRPHQGLGGATPLEILLDLTTARSRSRDPPRARPGHGPNTLPFRMSHLDSRGHRLPLLEPAA